MGRWRRSAPLLAAGLVGLSLGHWLGGTNATPPPVPAGPMGGLVSASAQAAPTYTCSMHPSVRLPDPAGRCPICFMDLIPAPHGGADGIADVDPSRLAMSEAAVALAEIRTTEVERRFPEAELRLSGRLRPDGTRRVRVTAPFAGRVERLRVSSAGVQVSRLTPLVDVSSPELLSAFEDLRRARRTVMRAAGASDFLRSRSADELERARERLIALGAKRSQIAVIEVSGSVERAVPIVAPADGVVVTLPVQEGDRLNAGAEVATLDDLGHLWLELDADESQWPLLAVGAPMRFEVHAFPGESFEGIVALVEPRIDERSRTAVVRVEVDNADGRLVPGMLASAMVRVRLARDGVVDDPLGAEMPLVIPASAPLLTGTRAVVYVRVPDAGEPLFEGRQVELGRRAGDDYVVRAGLSEGESVVLHGAFRIDSEMQIAARPSMMSIASGERPRLADASSDRTARADPLDAVLRVYLDAQDALAGDDLDGFLEAVTELGVTLDAVDAAALSDERRARWSDAEALLRQPAVPITLEQARVHFDAMSEGALVLARILGPSATEPTRLAFCPMAFDGRGAQWLQRGDAIRNPYFGSSMLRCGELRELPVPRPPRTSRS